MSIQDHEPRVDGHCDSGISLGCSCGWNEWDATTRREHPAQFSESWWEHIAADSLDAAWAEAEAALPEGWRLASLLSPGDYSFDERGWEMHAQNEDGKTRRAHGPTPAAALRALAEKLRTP